MALYNEINVGRYNRFLQKFFGLKGGPPAPQLTSEISVAMSLFSGAENRYLESWDRFGATQLCGAVAAQTSAVRLRNPATSNTIAVIEKMTAFEVATDVVFIDFNLGDADLGGPLTGIRMDRRGRPNSTCTISSGNNPSVNGFAFGSFQTGTCYEFIQSDLQEIVLLPGDTIQMRTTALNVTLRGAYLWRERALEEGERT